MYFVTETDKGSAIRSIFMGKSLTILLDKSVKVSSEKNTNSKLTVFAIKKVFSSPFHTSEKELDWLMLVSSNIKYSFADVLSEYSI